MPDEQGDFNLGNAHFVWVYCAARDQTSIHYDAHDWFVPFAGKLSERERVLVTEAFVMGGFIGACRPKSGTYPWYNLMEKIGALGADWWRAIRRGRRGASATPVTCTTSDRS